MDDHRDHRDPRRRVPLAVCYAGGGTFGIAWHLAVTAALGEFGLDVASAPLVGTSAGSWAAPAVRLGLGVDDFAALSHIRVPDPRPGALWRVAAELFGSTTTVREVTVAAVELPTMRRVLFDGAEHPAADLAAASSAVPGLFAPHRVGRRICIDGGVRSMASIDAVGPAELMVVSLPIAGALFGPVGRSLEATSRRMVHRWRARHGGVALVLRPPAAVTSAVGSDPRALFDTERALEVYPRCVEAARRRLGDRLDAVTSSGVWGGSGTLGGSAPLSVAGSRR